MAFTLAEAGKYTRNVLVRGIIEILITESAVLQYLPFVTIVGSGLDYNQETTLGSASWFAVGDTWTETTPTVTKQTATLTILGGDSDLDNFLNQVLSNEQDIEAQMVAEKAKKIAYAFNDAFFNGDSAVTTNQFDGLSKKAGAVQNALTGYTSALRAASNGANGATLDLSSMDIFIDQIKPGKPDALFMSKRSRRKLGALKRASGSGVLETGANSYGRRVTMYDGIPIEVDENISDAQTQGVNADCSSIFAVRFGFKSGVCGIQNGGITAVKIGDLETKDAKRTRIKWYVSLAIFNNWSFVRLAGVRD